jgi:CMP-N,N'-diacetyllegionaminic acid synthase
LALSALIIGFGSIGKRHTKILNEMDEINYVSVLSSQHNLPFETITSLEDIPVLNPDYVVISSPPTQHYSQLKFLEAHLEDTKILVEKPLFDSMADLVIKHNEVYVGYNLRFHPLLQKIKDAVTGRKLWNIQVFCGSYLPDWRPGRDYTKTYSAKKDVGGGVLLDLSHELDYVQWLTESLKVEHVVSEKVSVLEIDSDDLLIFLGKTQNGAHVHINLNYFTRKPIRQIIIDGEGISIQGDLITRQLSVLEDGETSDYSWPKLGSNNTYRAQHQAIFEGNSSLVCTFEEGLATMRLIDDIRSFNSQ